MNEANLVSGVCWCVCSGGGPEGAPQFGGRRRRCGDETGQTSSSWGQWGRRRGQRGRKQHRLQPYRLFGNGGGGGGGGGGGRFLYTTERGRRFTQFTIGWQQ